MSQDFLGILLIEENPADAQVVQEALKGSAHLIAALTVVETLDAALAYLRQDAPYTRASPPALIILDWHVSGDGKRFIETIKSDAALKRIPIIVLTGMEDDHTIGQLYDLGINCCVQKPLEANQFFHLMEKVEQYWCRTVTLPLHQKPKNRQEQESPLLLSSLLARER